MRVQQPGEDRLRARCLVRRRGAQASALPVLDGPVVGQQQAKHRRLRGLGVRERSVAALDAREGPVRVDRMPERFGEVGERRVDRCRQGARRHRARIDPVRWIMTDRGACYRACC